MSMFTHERHPFVYSVAIPVHEAKRRRLTRQKAHNGFGCFNIVRFSTRAPSDKLETAIVVCHLYAEGLWLELFSANPMQPIQAIICRADSKEKVVQQSFILPKGKSSFFWSFSKVLCPDDMYVLLIRGEKHLLQWKFL